MIRRNVMLRLAVVIAILFISILCSNSSYAMTEDEIYKALLINGMSRCYNSEQMAKNVSPGNFVSFNHTVLLKGEKQNYIYIPTRIGVGNELDTQDTPGTQIGCYELFLGDPAWNAFSYPGNMKGLFEIFGKTEPKASTSNLKDILSGLGYKKNVMNSSKQICVHVKYGLFGNEGNDLIDAGKVCWNEDDFTNGNIGNVYDAISLKEESRNEGSKIYFNVDYYLSDYLQITAMEDTYGYSCSMQGMNKNVTNNGVEAVKELDGKHCDIIDIDPGYSVYLSVEYVDSGNSVSSQEMESYQAGYDAASEYFSGKVGLTKFEDKEKAELYSLYFNKVYSVQMANNPDCKSTKAEVGSSPIINDVDGTKYYVYTSQNAWCRISVESANKSKTVSVFGNDDYQLREGCDFDCLVEKMFALDLDNVDMSESGLTPGSTTGSEESEEPEEPTCMNSGAAETLGWIVCPILQWLSNASQTVYNEYVEPSLRVEPILFSESKDEGTMFAWSVFQNIANTIFIIILLFVIFSQLTGVGIDNYGIKKILPKLIIAAVLINLSYVICTAAVDISNIVGNGLQNLFNGLLSGQSMPECIKLTGAAISDAAVAANENCMPIESGVTGASVGATAIWGVALLGVFAVGIWAVVQAEGAPGLILMLLVAAISIIISILFLFILLAARQAAIIVLTVVSPIAFVCFTLPNTKKIFDKWLKFGWGLLLVYPICGMLVGGGNFVSKLLLISGAGTMGMFMAFTAMIVGVIPIFFIPTVLKGSFAAMGNLGAKISGFGKNLSGRIGGNVEKAVKGSARYKESQVRVSERGKARQAIVARRRSQGTINRYRGRDNLTSGQERELALAEQRLASLDKEQEGLYESQFSNYDRDQLENEYKNVDSWYNSAGGSQRMSALIKTMEANGMERGIAEMLRNKNISKDASVMHTLANSNNKVFKAYGKAAAGSNVSYDDFMKGTDANISMKKYAADKGNAFNDNLDDKALSEINKYSGSGNEIMSTSQLIAAANKMNSEDALAEVNTMLQSRNDVNFSGEDLINFNDSTLEVLENMRKAGNSSVGASLVRAADSIAKSPEIASRISRERKEYLNKEFRRSRGLTDI